VIAHRGRRSALHPVGAGGAGRVVVEVLFSPASSLGEPFGEGRIGGGDGGRRGSFARAIRHIRAEGECSHGQN